MPSETLVRKVQYALARRSRYSAFQIRSSSERGSVTAATCLVVTLPSGCVEPFGVSMICTRARASRWRRNTRRGSRSRMSETYPYGPLRHELYVDARARGQLAVARRHERVGARPQHRGEHVRTLLLGRLDVPAVVARREPAAHDLLAVRVARQRRVEDRPRARLTRRVR